MYYVGYIYDSGRYKAFRDRKGAMVWLMQQGCNEDNSYVLDLEYGEDLKLPNGNWLDFDDIVKTMS